MVRSLSIRSLISLVVTGVALAFGLALFLAPQPRAPEETRRLPRFDLQGHRGARGLAPENTLAGFERALAVGVTTLEMDLRMSADGVVMVHHDARLSAELARTAEGEWVAAPGPRLAGLTAAEIGRYDVGRAAAGGEIARRFPEQAPADGARVPRLDQVLALGERRSGGRVRYGLEIKLPPAASEPGAGAFVEAVLARVRAAGVALRTTVQSFNWRVLKQVRRRNRDVAVAFLTVERRWRDTVRRGRPGASPWTAGIDVDAYGASLPHAVHAAAAAFAGTEAGGALPPVERVVWAPYFRDLRPPQLREAHRRGLKVIVWTVNDPAAMASLIELGVDGIVTDYPDRLRAVMRDRGMKVPPSYPAAAE